MATNSYEEQLKRLRAIDPLATPEVETSGGVAYTMPQSSAAPSAELATAGASSLVPGASLALGAVGTAANIWSGYRADKAADRAQEVAEEQADYERKRQNRADAQAYRRALKGEVQSDLANTQSTIDWMASQYTGGK